jgi:hypothetical protein
MENNNMNQNNNQRGQMTRSENKNNNGNNIKKVGIIAGICAAVIGGFFLVKTIRNKRQEKAQQADKKDAE